MPSFSEKKKSSAPALSMDNNRPPAKNAFTGKAPKAYTGNVKASGSMPARSSMTKPTITAPKKTAKAMVSNSKGGKKLGQSMTASAIKKPGKKK